MEDLQTTKIRNASLYGTFGGKQRYPGLPRWVERALRGHKRAFVEALMRGKHLNWLRDLNTAYVPLSGWLVNEEGIHPQLIQLVQLTGRNTGKSLAMSQLLDTHTFRWMMYRVYSALPTCFSLAFVPLTYVARMTVGKSTDSPLDIAKLVGGHEPSDYQVQLLSSIAFNDTLGRK